MAKKKVTTPIKKTAVVVDLKDEPVKQIDRGLGDKIAKVTSFLGIPTCDDCEARRLKLNKAFPFLRAVKRELTEEEIKDVLQMEKTNIIQDIAGFIKLFNEVFGTRQRGCNCPSLYRELLSKLVMQIQYQNIK